MVAALPLIAAVAGPMPALPLGWEIAAFTSRPVFFDLLHARPRLIVPWPETHQAPPSVVARPAPRPAAARISPSPPLNMAQMLRTFLIRRLTAARAVAASVSPKQMPAQPVLPAEVMQVKTTPAVSLIRALGLKVNRIVIDAGHGGFDDGAIGPHGAKEKDIVLDVALRTARLARSLMGVEVVLTRDDDNFVTLRERTAVANDRKGDLFLSIHANSSPSPAVAGTETYVLNFTSDRTELDVAWRENATSTRSVGDLKGLIQSIGLNEKIAESETFARMIQTSMAGQVGRSNPVARDRGVKRAPFMVLTGASMPSILAEIGFLSNSGDESNLGKPEYRQKIAEALYEGLWQYARSLDMGKLGSLELASM